MKIKDLIAELQKRDPNTEVVTRVRDYSDFDSINPNIEYDGKFWIEDGKAHKHKEFSSFVDENTKRHYDNGYSYLHRNKYEKKQRKILIIG